MSHFRYFLIKSCNGGLNGEGELLVTPLCIRLEANSRASDFNKLLDQNKLTETVVKYTRTEIKETS